MGWTGTKGQTRAQLVAELTRKTESGTTVLFTEVPAGLWSILEITAGDHKGQRIICLDLMEQQGPYLMHKPMDETVGPCYYDCPLSYLEAATDFAGTAYSAEWRKKVREHWKAREPIQGRPRLGRAWNDSRDIEDAHSDADPGL